MKLCKKISLVMILLYVGLSRAVLVDNQTPESIHITFQHETTGKTIDYEVPAHNKMQLTVEQGKYKVLVFKIGAKDPSLVQKATSDSELTLKTLPAGMPLNNVEKIPVNVPTPLKSQKK